MEWWYPISAPATHDALASGADLLRRLGRNAEAALAYEAAIARTENAAERDFLRRGRDALTRA
jgi:predicted RNA polymerase sigma factor